MIGEITFDKSSKDMNLFLYSVYLIGKYGTNYEIRRNFHQPCFVELMADYTESKAYKLKDGKEIEERTLFNKSLYAQYYGFIDRRKNNEKKELLRLTTRGKILYELIECDEEKGSCCIKEGNQYILQDLIWDSIVYDSFGKNNDGAQTSCTDIDAPKVIFRVIFDLGFATNEEIFYVLFSLNRGDKGNLKITKTYQQLIQEIKDNREKDNYDYSSFFNANGLKNKVGDSKVIDILSDPVIGILNKVYDRGLIFNYLSNNCNRFKDEDANKFSCWYSPQTLVLYFKSLATTTGWLKQTILNKHNDNDNAVWLDLSQLSSTQLCAKLATSAIEAQKDPSRNITVVLTCDNEDELTSKLGHMVALLRRVDDYTSIEHGSSTSTIVEPSLGNVEIRFPSNFNFISLIKEN